jgi:hypothetical protein
VERRGKKTAAAVHQEITRELDALLPRIFAERRKTGDLDLEAVELAFRTAFHSAGATGLSELLRQPGPIPTTVACSCGHQARYKDMRRKPILTVLGPAKMFRAYYWCSRCRQGQFPADIAGDIQDTEFSPGVRRMLALVGSECASFDHGRQQMELLADLEVTAKAVERVTEAIGADIARHQQETIQQAMQLELPVAVGEPIPKIGSWTEFVKAIVLRSFLENDKFRLECSHALGLEEQVVRISVASASVDEQPDIAIDRLYDSEPYLDVAVIENAFQVGEQHPRQFLEGFQALPAQLVNPLVQIPEGRFFVGVGP